MTEFSRISKNIYSSVASGEAYSEPCQSKMEWFEKKGNGLTR